MSAGVCGTLQSSLLGLAKLVQTTLIAEAGEMRPEGGDHGLLFRQKTGIPETGMVVGTPSLSKGKKVPSAWAGRLDHAKID